MDTYNTTIKLVSKTATAAIMRRVDILRTEEIDGETVRSGYSDGTIQVNIAQGEIFEEASYFLSTGDRVIVVSSHMGRDGYFGMDEDIMEFDTVGDAFDHALMLWNHLTPRETKENLIEVQIVGQDHLAELDNGEIIDHVRAVIARFDPELPVIIAEMEKEEEEDEE